MGQEIVKHGGAAELIKSSDHRIVVNAPTANQQRLRQMLQGGVSPEQSRCYHPPEMLNEHAEWESENAYPIAVGSQNTRQLTAYQKADPKACFTGFTFGILCAGAIGVASFLSLATVVTPQPSVAALVPLQLESQFIPSVSELQRDRLEGETAINTHHQSAWQRLSRFHKSAGKFSQPGIRVVSSLEPGTEQGGRERAQLPGKRKEARLEPQPRTGILPVKSDANGRPLNQDNAIVEVRLINVAAEEGPSTMTGENTEVTPREPILFEKRTERSARVGSYRDISDLASETGSGAVDQPLEPADTRPEKQASLAPISNSRKVFRSSLTPTARAKVRLPGRYSTSISRSRRLRKVAKKKNAVALKPSVFAIQARPEWARAAFNLTNI